MVRSVHLNLHLNRMSNPAALRPPILRHARRHPMTPATIAVLEERIAWLQRHVTEQDRAMLEMAGELERLKKQVAELRAKQTEGGPDDSGPTDQRPPHY